MSDELFLFVLGYWALFFGVSGMTAAAVRGGSGPGGFALGLFFGPIGVVLAFWLANQENGERELLENGLRKRCLYCDELVRPAAIACPHCQRHPDAPEMVKSEA